MTPLAFEVRRVRLEPGSIEHDAELEVRLVGDLAVTDQGAIIYAETDFPCLELAIALRRWIRDECPSRDFEFDSMEHERRGLVWLRRDSTSGLWRMGSITEPTTTSEPAIWPAVRRAIDEFCGTLVASSPRGVQARVRSLIDREPVAASTEIYVRLLDEGALVWRPVRAEYLGDDRFRITDERMAALEEVWEFANGDEVRCEMTQGYDGPMLTATRRSDD